MFGWKPRVPEVIEVHVHLHLHLGEERQAEEISKLAERVQASTAALQGSLPTHQTGTNHGE